MISGLSYSILYRAKFRGMLIWVLADNPSRHFYESLDGQPIRES